MKHFIIMLLVLSCGCTSARYKYQAESDKAVAKRKTYRPIAKIKASYLQATDLVVEVYDDVDVLPLRRSDFDTGMEHLTTLVDKACPWFFGWLGVREFADRAADTYYSEHYTDIERTTN